ncbi:EAL domain-containing protein [Piscinibacter aquaticus]|uniref:EAL domain-containing protein n=1 Tax=Piscinibacter aquaticus TaxID=392597 RepID=A0A5C6TYU2_9BURK|nr:EAL domain-containing protein [Piscinibacter aquaticus]
MGATVLCWGALPWLAFAAADPAARAAAATVMLAAALAEALALRAMSRVAIAQAAVTIAPPGLWLLVAAESPAWSVATGLFAGLGLLAALCLSRDRQLHALMAAEADLRHQSAADAEHVDRIARLELELARAGAALAAAQAESAAREALARAGEAQSAQQRTIDLEKRSLELAREAVTDPLTLLPNRKGINQHLVELLAPMERPGNDSELALLFLDLDKFKEINDQLGHRAGDAVLRVVAERLRECLPRSAFPARWGGDEFIVVLPGLGRIEQVRMVAEKVRAELLVPIRLEDGTVRVGCSVGIALAPYHGQTPEALIIAADRAVYAAKTEDKDRVRVFDVAMAKKAQRQHQIAQALPGALERNQLAVAYQPIVNALDGVASHVEALARWPHPTWGPVSPGEFIEVAERNGQIHAMGRWVLRQACLDAARWPGANPPKVSVNVSAAQVSSGKLVSQVREALAAAKLPPQRLVIELTESLPMARSEGVSQTLSDLRAMGVTLALDDFGTGYSSLSSLMKQPVSLVKIDQSFVKDVPGGGEVLIKATVDVARRFGLEVVAEGVETALQRSRLESLGVNYMQGWLFGRPMPADEFIAWLGLRDGSNEPFVLRA